jgi:hypothetical protein
MKKRFRIASFFFCRLLLTKISCRYIGTCRNADTAATLSVDWSKREPRLRCVVRSEREQALLLQRFLALIRHSFWCLQRNEVRVPNFTTPHSNSLPQGEREVRLELRSDDKIFCRIRVSSQLIRPGLRAGNPQRLAANSNSNLDLIGDELIFARRRRLW